MALLQVAEERLPVIEAQQQKLMEQQAEAAELLKLSDAKQLSASSTLAAVEQAIADNAAAVSDNAAAVLDLQTHCPADALERLTREAASREEQIAFCSQQVEDLESQLREVPPFALESWLRLLQW